MKRKILCLNLVLVMLFAYFAISAFAQSKNVEIYLMRANTKKAFEGATTIYTYAGWGEDLCKDGNAFEWSKVVVFDYDEVSQGYRCIATYELAPPKNDVKIPENGFVITANGGNNWPELFKNATGNEWYYNAVSPSLGIPYSECPCFINDTNNKNIAALESIQIGDIFYTVGLDIENVSIDSNEDGENIGYWDDIFESYSYITSLKPGFEESSSGISSEPNTSGETSTEPSDIFNLPWSEKQVDPASVNSKGVSPISGAFISPWLYYNYSDAEWEKAANEWKYMGIEYLIMGEVAKMDLATLTITAAYPCTIENAVLGDDLVTVFFEKCAQFGFKIIIGTGGTPEGWPYVNFSIPGNDQTFKEVCGKFAAIAEDVYNVYYDDYKDVFAGFYFSPELFNSSAFDTVPARKAHVEGLSGGINILLDKITSLNPDLPLVLSPYVNLFGGNWVSKDYGNITTFWKEFLSEAHFRDGDILCPQDSCGAHGCDTAHLEDMTKAYRAAVDACGKDIKLYSNCEIFDQPPDELLWYDGFTTWSTMLVTDMIDHFYIVSKYVDRIFTFTYPVYIGTVTTVDCYYDTYLDFIKYGTIDTEPPKAPDTFTTMFLNSKSLKGETVKCLNVFWSGMYDNYGIHRINIYKNGKYLTYRVPIRKDYSSARKQYPNSFFDTDYTETTNERVVYEFEAIDCCGNVSERVSFTVEPGSVPNNVKLGAAYNGPVGKDNSGTESSEEPVSEENSFETTEPPVTDKNNFPFLFTVSVAAGILAIAAIVSLIKRKRKKNL